jgi:predicted Ser/Thr protein kinase
MSFSLRDYQVIDEIGRGAFGSVFRARQRSLDRLVAIKTLAPHRVQNGSDIARFQREARTMASLAHDNIVAVFDYAFFSGNYYIVMEYIEGITLESALEANLPTETLLFALRKVASGLACAHAAEIAHRDVKPGNVLLGKQGQVKVADFGLASFKEAVSRYSSINAAVGTLCYMAPEAIVSPGQADDRVDVFSFGCMLYQALTGRLPFPGGTIGDVSYKLLNEPPEPIERADFAQVQDLAMRCIEKERDQRPSMEVVRRRLAEATHASSHQAQDTFLAFMQRGVPLHTTASAIGKSDTIASIAPAPVRASKRVPWLVWAATAAALIAAAFIGGLKLRSRNQAPPPAHLPQLEKLAAVGAMSESRIVVQRDSVPDRDAPAPLAAMPSMETATIIIEGVGKEDTVTLNGVRVAHRVRGGRLKVQAPTGVNEIEVIRPGAAGKRKRFDMMPYNVTEWNVADE